MKYIVRAVKYFFYFCFLLALILTVLVLIRAVPADLEQIFVNGYDSYWQIALMFAAVSAFYPMFGFMKKDILAPGEPAEHRAAILEYMEARGYALETEGEGVMTFRLRSTFGRIAKMCEDRITLSRYVSGYTVEGLRRDVVRIANGLDSRLGSL